MILVGIAVCFAAVFVMMCWLGYEIHRAPLYDEHERPIPPVPDAVPPEWDNEEDGA